MQVGDLVKRTFTNGLYAEKDAVGLVVNSRLGRGELTGHNTIYSVLWSDGQQFQHWDTELETISGIG
tara:strand:+ start:483 stop:683 length:201 start_codon:yes stop_codon:yes gene_type:complete